MIFNFKLEENVYYFETIFNKSSIIFIPLFRIWLRKQGPWLNQLLFNSVHLKIQLEHWLEWRGVGRAEGSPVVVFVVSSYHFTAEATHLHTPVGNTQECKHG